MVAFAPIVPLSIAPAPAVPAPIMPKRLGVFLPNWIGDVVMATPALRALRKLVGPSGQLVGVMRPYVADVLAGTHWLDDIVLYSKDGKCPELSGRAAQRQLRELDLDCAVLLTNSLRTAWMAWRGGARERIGYVGDFRALLLTKRLRETDRDSDDLPIPTIDSYLKLAEAAGCAPEPPRLELATRPEDERAADALWKRFGLPSGDQVVVLNSGGAFGSTKHWPAEHFAKLAQRIVAKWGFSVLVHCGPAERDDAARIVALAGDRRIVGMSELDRLPMGLAKACVRRSRMLVSTDSGLRFFGIAFGKPVVTLFGPTAPEATRTHYDRETCLSLSLDCQPCMERTCPLGHHRCLRDLSVDQVYAAVAAGFSGSVNAESRIVA